MQFEWDETKAEANLKKHGVSFLEAQTVFDDLFSIEFFDPKHSESENRFLIVGQAENGDILIVSFIENRDKIRLISARLVTPKERKNYEHGRFE